MERTKWVDRKFTFDFPEGWIFDILERLRGTPVRIKEMMTGISDEHASLHHNGKWSIKENIGHLYDLEALHEGRLDDFIAGKEILRAADMSNALTNESHHNDRSVDTLLQMFTISRQDFIAKLESLNDETQLRRAMHPRLKVKMRPIDVAYFTAEHDDHHLASIREIRRMVNNE